MAFVVYSWLKRLEESCCDRASHGVCEHNANPQREQPEESHTPLQPLWQTNHVLATVAALTDRLFHFVLRQ